MIYEGTTVAEVTGSPFDHDYGVMGFASAFLMINLDLVSLREIFRKMKLHLTSKLVWPKVCLYVTFL